MIIQVILIGKKLYKTCKLLIKHISEIVLVPINEHKPFKQHAKSLKKTLQKKEQKLSTI